MNHHVLQTVFLCFNLVSSLLRMTRHISVFFIDTQQICKLDPLNFLGGCYRGESMNLWCSVACGKQRFSYCPFNLGINPVTSLQCVCFGIGDICPLMSWLLYSSGQEE